MTLLRWLGRNISTLLIAFILASIVWASAVTAVDPNEERVFDIPIEVLGKNTNIEIVGEIQDQLSITLYAPSSILNEIDKEPNALRAWIDISAFRRGVHNVEVQYTLPEDIRPLRLIDISPTSVDIQLEELGSKTLKIQTKISGEPALGYQQGTFDWSDEEVQVSGRLSDIENVTSVDASLDISGADENINTTVPLVPRDANGNLVPDVNLSPEKITVSQTINLQGGYRNMAVKVVTSGQVAEGYRQSSVSVSPPNVLVFSSDVAMIEQLPGYIETEVLDLTDAVNDIETVLALNLPENVSVIGDPNVIIQVGVAAIEGSISISREVNAIGTMPGLEAAISPNIVELIILGPVPTLQTLTEVDVRVIVDLTGLAEGTYQLEPEVVILPDGVTYQVISPKTVEIEITTAEPENLTPTPSP
jgi:YbbR domain-containing protein